jgi:hypothetical protein
MISNCECGSTTFYVTEALHHLASVEEGKLVATNTTSNTAENSIFCTQCGKEFDLEKDFGGEIEFAW